MLAQHCFKKFAHDKSPRLRGFSRRALLAMETHEWPGNVRELVNRVRRAMVMSEGRLITPRDLGLAGASDFRTVVQRRSGGDPDAALAVDVTAHRLVKYVGAYAAVLGRLDALVFTAGIGENSAELREAVCGRRK